MVRPAALSNWGIGSAGSLVGPGGGGFSGCAGEMARSRLVVSRIQSAKADTVKQSSGAL
jgi:hypothetical protein